MSSENQDIPFHPVIIKVTTAAVAVTATLLSIYSLHSWIFPSMLIVVLFGTKLACPRIPLIQITMLVVVIFIISAIVNLLLQVSILFYFLGEIIVPLICVSGFGCHWVKHQYIPIWSNRW